MRSAFAAVALSTLLLALAPASASASGAYQCCLIDKAGYRYVYQSRASSKYKGTMDGLCVNAAREEKARRCSGQSAISLGYDFVRGRGDWGPDQQPERVNLFTRCSAENCKVGLTVKGGAKLSVSASNKAACRLLRFPSPKDPPGTLAYTLRMTLAPGQANTCVLDIDGKTTSFFSDIDAPL